MQTGARNLITDVGGLRVGNARDDRLKSGVTVLVGARPFTAGVHVMGGAPGTRETDLLHPDRLVEEVDALVLAGGSAFGLDAASGVADALAEQGRGFSVGGVRVPIVPAAILFDLENGGDKGWARNPYGDLGKAALAAASDRFALGSEGAGTGATAGVLKGGLGSASFVLECGVTVAALAAVNPLGEVVQPAGAHFWAAPFEQEEEFGGLGPAANTDVTAEPGLPVLPPSGRNTTLGIIATDARLSKAQCSRLATVAHDGFARAIVPSHTPFDGDLVFAVATGERALSAPAEDILRLGHAASLCMARAIARGVYHARAASGDLVPAWRDRFAAREA